MKQYVKMNAKRIEKFFVIFFVCISSIAFNGSSLNPGDDIYDRINKNLEKFGRIYREISLNYVDEINTDRFVKAGIDGMLSTLDPYTSFSDDFTMSEIDLITSGRYGGIGITVGVKNNSVVITDVMNGYEAQRKGLRKGDKIITINGTTITPEVRGDLNSLVRGPVGTQLYMKVERDDSEFDFNLTREEIILKNVPYYGFIGDETDRIAYFKLDRFTNNTENEVDNVIKTLKAQGKMNGLIIDLRNNSGGLLDAANGLLNKIVPRNSLLVITKGNRADSERKVFSKDNPLIGEETPVVVLINENTASASEIVAGAIQDLDRGVIVGSKSFGKGLVQVIKNLNDNSQLKLTTSRYFTPSGRWIQSKDYFKENLGGVFLNAREFSQEQFSTLNGRTVYAYGGITPDVEVNLAGESRIHKELSDKDMFFKYTRHYLEIYPRSDVFKADDGTFEEFKNFISSNGFSYKSEADKKIGELREIAAGKSYSEEFMRYLNLLESEVEENQRVELDNAKSEILRSIEAEINRSIITEFEQIKAALESDMQLLKAVEIIHDVNKYNNILRKF